MGMEETGETSGLFLDVSTEEEKLKRDKRIKIQSY